MIPLIVDLDTEWRGGQSQALLLLKGLYERGHAAELLTAKGSSLGRRAKRVGIYVHEVSRGMLRVPAAMKIRGLISDGRVDLLHANEAHAVTAAWLSGAHRSVPLVASRRVGYPIGKSQISQARYRAASCVVANSNFPRRHRKKQRARDGGFATRTKFWAVWERCNQTKATSG